MKVSPILSFFVFVRPKSSLSWHLPYIPMCEPSVQSTVRSYSLEFCSVQGLDYLAELQLGFQECSFVSRTVCQVLFARMLLLSWGKSQIQQAQLCLSSGMKWGVAEVVLMWFCWVQQGSLSWRVFNSAPVDMAECFVLYLHWSVAYWHSPCLSSFHITLVSAANGSVLSSLVLNVFTTWL